MSMGSRLLEGEYELRGEYHKHLDKKWKYYPIYIEKMRFIRSYLDNISKSKKIVDLGCGEGVLVEEYKKKGYNIIGRDSNYTSGYVKKGDITKLNLKSNSFDLVLILDVLEHLSFQQQGAAISEMRRILRKNGKAMVSIPNLAHFASRVTFLFFGKLLRTSSIERHIGDRPIGEYIKLFKRYKFTIIRHKGLFPTLPLISALTYYFPDKVLWLHKIYNRFLAHPNFCFQNILEIKKK